MVRATEFEPVTCMYDIMRTSEIEPFERNTFTLIASKTRLDYGRNPKPNASRRRIKLYQQVTPASVRKDSEFQVSRQDRLFSSGSSSRLSYIREKLYDDPLA